MPNTFHIGDLVRQIEGPCKYKTFRVKSVSGNLLYIVLEPLLVNYNKNPEWSYFGNYEKVVHSSCANVCIYMILSSLSH